MKNSDDCGARGEKQAEASVKAPDSTPRRPYVREDRTPQRRRTATGSTPGNVKRLSGFFENIAEGSSSDASSSARDFPQSLQEERHSGSVQRQTEKNCRGSQGNSAEACSGSHGQGDNGCNGNHRYCKAFITAEHQVSPCEELLLTQTKHEWKPGQGQRTNSTPTTEPLSDTTTSHAEEPSREETTPKTSHGRRRYVRRLTTDIVGLGGGVTNKPEVGPHSLRRSASLRRNHRMNHAHVPAEHQSTPFRNGGETGVKSTSPVNSLQGGPRNEPVTSREVGRTGGASAAEHMAVNAGPKRSENESRNNSMVALPKQNPAENEGARGEENAGNALSGADSLKNPSDTTDDIDGLCANLRLLKF